MDTQEEIALPEGTVGELQNNNNLLEGEDEKTSVTESNIPDKTPLPVCNDSIIHTISEKTHVVSIGGSSDDNVGVPIVPQVTEVSEEDRQTGKIQSLPCNLQPEQEMEVAEQLEGLHFKNHTTGEHHEGTLNDCPPACVKIVAYEDEDSSSEDSSSDSDSDSDSSSSSSTSSSSSSSLSSMLQLEEEPIENIDVPLKTKDELLVDELPAVEELSISLPDHVELKPFGTVSSIIEQLVIIESLRDVLPLNEDSVVFKEDRSVAGKIFEIFGPVPHPFYVVRFNSKDHIESKGIKIKDAMFFAPSVEDFTQYIIPDALKREKGSDASWTNDQEPPADAIEYSDDEKEREAKQKKKAQNPGKKKQKFDQQNQPSSMLCCGVPNKEEDPKMMRYCRHRRYWIHPITAAWMTHGVHITLYVELRQYPEKFASYLRMSVATFDDPLPRISERVCRQDTHLRRSISPEEHLIITLRFLASGESFLSLPFQFHLGISTTSGIVRTICQALWDCLLADFLPQPSTEQWLGIAEKLQEVTQFPYCVGAIDGKHIRIQMPMHMGSEYYNYKKFFSTILMAVADAQYKFIAVDIGSYGRTNNSRMFKNSAMGRRIFFGEM
ncbi:H/ACA ribonucleoprotein complex non-core subunit NAF1 isoform X1 [Hyla sarda]|uniref:H/ACA ribonucleoprotein complex non-core subunit NAF1 isoform X1 n=1 Tax=Hyla sarda TaxID=327740 RepID=UPI0024C248FE|nr:H/ACA ribonucleoprotein complex non-core subunit NAF1 isoform X1 [Hyla sarda]